MNQYEDDTAEGALLGSILIDTSKYFDVLGLVDIECFAKSEHKLIFALLKELLDDGQTVIDLVLIKSKLIAKNQLMAVGGIEYLVELANTVPSSANAVHYAEIVKDKYYRRRIRDYANSLLIQTKGEEDTQMVYANACADIQNVFDGKADNKHTMLSDTLEDFNLDDSTNYISTGFSSHDLAYYGHGQGQMIIVAGRPGSGKTSLLLEMAIRQCDKDTPVAFFSLEMSSRDLVQRILCSRASVNLRNVMQGSLTLDDEMRIEAHKKKLEGKPIILDETRMLTASTLRSRIYSLKHQHGVKVVYLDYIQLMTGDGDNRQQVVSDISRSIKLIALQLDIPIIVGCQLNRKNEMRSDKRPVLSDLRESGGIENNADIVLLLHRPGYYDTSVDSTMAEAIIAKSRRGITETIPMTFVKEYCRFDESGY